MVSRKTLDLPRRTRQHGGVSEFSALKRNERPQCVLGDQDTPGVCTENLNPDVMVMQSAEYRVRLDIPDSLNGTKGRRIFVQ